MIRRNPLLLLILLALGAVPAAGPVHAADDPTQVFWMGDWEKAFEKARAEKKAVMLCINSLDTEKANNRIAKNIYRDPEFVRESRKLVMIVASTIMHWPKKKCPRFGHITCQEHRDCEKALRAGHFERFRMSLMSQEIVSPQHAWFAPDESLLKRIEFETRPSSAMKGTLLKNMRSAVKLVKAGEYGAKSEGSAAPTPEDAGPDAPLTAQDRTAIEKLKTAKEKSIVEATLNRLLRVEKIATQSAVVDALRATKNAEKKCWILRALGTTRVVDAIPAIGECFKSKQPLVRSFAAVALENIGHENAIDILIARGKKERDAMTRRNVWRALGVCAGPVAHEGAAKALLKATKSDKQTMVRKHAAIAMRQFGTEAAKKLVVSKLEKMLKGKVDADSRGGIVYALAYIGNSKTTLPIFEKARDDTNTDYVKRFYKTAILILKKQESGFGRSAWYLFREDRDDPARKND